MNSENWRSTLVGIRASIGDAIKNLNDSGLQIALIVDENDKLAGTVTDGDVRRGLLRGLTLADSVDKIVHADPLVVPHGLRMELVADLMRINRVGQLPCVDESRRVTGLYLWDQLDQPSEALDNVFVIMAGGKGVRLRPYTENCPKPLLMVGDKPILQHIIERAALEGFRNFVIAIHYLGQMIVDHFGDGRELGVNITYLQEQNPLGTGGALSLLDIVPTSPLIVTNGDVLTSIRYTEILEFHHRHRAAATMAVRTHEMQNPFGVVHTDGVSIMRFEEKPSIRSQINAGIYVIDSETLQLLLPDQHCDMPTLFERVMQSSRRAVAFPMHEAWLDVGRHDDLEAARRMAE